MRTSEIELYVSHSSIHVEGLYLIETAGMMSARKVLSGVSLPENGVFIPRTVRNLSTGAEAPSLWVERYWREEGKAEVLYFRVLLSQLESSYNPTLVSQVAGIGFAKEVRDAFRKFGLKTATYAQI